MIVLLIILGKHPSLVHFEFQMFDIRSSLE